MSARDLSVRQDGREQCGAIIGWPPIALVGEAFREAGPGIDLQQHIGDLQARQQAVGKLLRRFGFLRCIGTQRRDLQLAVNEGGIRQTPRLGQIRDNRQVALQQLTASCKVV